MHFLILSQFVYLEINVECVDWRQKALQVRMNEIKEENKK